MPHCKSARKRVKTNEIRRKRNVARRSRMRHAIRDLRESIAKADGPNEELLAKAQDVKTLLDRMASKGILHQNAAARLKSRLTKQAQGSATG